MLFNLSPCNPCAHRPLHHPKSNWPMPHSSLLCPSYAPSSGNGARKMSHSLLSMSMCVSTHFCTSHFYSPTQPVITFTLNEFLASPSPPWYTPSYFVARAHDRVQYSRVFSYFSHRLYITIESSKHLLALSARHVYVYTRSEYHTQLANN